MPFKFVKPSALKRNDIIGVSGSEVSARAFLVQEINETEEVDGVPALEVRGIYISTDSKSLDDSCLALAGKEASSIKFRVRTFPNILLLREGDRSEEETE